MNRSKRKQDPGSPKKHLKKKTKRKNGLMTLVLQKERSRRSLDPHGRLQWSINSSSLGSQTSSTEVTTGSYAEALVSRKEPFASKVSAVPTSGTSGVSPEVLEAPGSSPPLSPYKQTAPTAQPPKPTSTLPTVTASNTEEDPGSKRKRQSSSTPAPQKKKQVKKKNGFCPICLKNFEQVRRHFIATHSTECTEELKSQFDLVTCSCGRLLARNGLKTHQKHCSKVTPSLGVRSDGDGLDLLFAVLQNDNSSSEQVESVYGTLARIPAFSKVWKPAEVKLINRAVSAICGQFLENGRPVELLRLWCLPKLGINPLFTRNKLSTLKKRLDNYPRVDGLELLRERLHEFKSGEVPLSKADKVERKVAQGRVGAAARVLTSKLGVAESSDKTFDKLKELHPQEAENNWNSNLTTHVPVQVDTTDILVALKRTSAETSGGPSGFDGRLVYSLRHNADFQKFLAKVANDMANGTQGLKRLFLSSRLIPLLKNKEGDVRPIAVGEILYRVCAKALLSRADVDLLPYQFGVKTPNGCEPISHLIEVKGVTHHVISTDLKNAFNSLNRNFLWSQVKRFASGLLGVFEWGYGQHSELFVQGVLRLMSESGVKQGDPLAPALFSMALRPILYGISCELKKAKVVIPGEEPLYAYLDDAYYLAQEGFKQTATEIITNGFNKFQTISGLVLRPEKSRHVTPKEFATGGFEVLGCHTGGGTKAFLQKVAENFSQKALSLQVLRKQSGHLIMTRCFRPGLNHLLRTVKCKRRHWKLADTVIMEHVRHLVGGFKNPKVQRCLVSLPIRMGGLGLALPSEVSKLVYGSSLNSSLQTLRNLFPEVVLPEGGEVVTQRECLQELWTKTRKIYMGKLNLKEKRQFVDLNGVLGTKWMHVLPCARHFAFNDGVFGAMMAERLALKNLFCHGCKLNVAFTHAQGCKSVQHVRTKRHQYVKEWLGQAYRQADAKVTNEPLDSTKKRRADLLISGRFCGGTRAVDITVRATSGTTADKVVNLAGPNLEPVGELRVLLQKSWDLKMEQNSGLDFGGAFRPFVLSSGGSMHPANLRDLDALRRRAPKAHTFLLYSLSASLRRSMAEAALSCFCRATQDS